MTNANGPAEGQESVLGAACPATAVLQQLDGKWALPAVAVLRGGALRTHALQRALPGVSAKVLAQTLRDLERLGVLTRTEIEAQVRHVEYELTELGQSLTRVLASLDDWAGIHARRMRPGSGS